MTEDTIEIPLILTTNVLFDTVTVTAEVEVDTDLLDDHLEMIEAARGEAQEMADSVFDYLQSEDVEVEMKDAKLEYGEYYMHVVVIIGVNTPDEHNKVERLLEEHEEFAEFLVDEA